MNHAEILALFTEDQRKNPNFPFTRLERTEHTLRVLSTQEPLWGTVIYSELTAANVEAVIQSEIEHFRAINMPFEWKVYDYDYPPDLKERLAAAGFAVEEPDALAVFDLQSPSPLFHPLTLDVRRITQPEDMPALDMILEAVWGESNNAAHRVGQQIRETPDQCSLYYGYVDGQPVCAAWANFYVNSPFMGLWAGSTLPDYRGRGLYTQVLAARLQEGRARGYQYAYIDAGAMSRPIVEKHGFQVLTNSYECNWKPDIKD